MIRYGVIMIPAISPHPSLPRGALFLPLEKGGWEGFYNRRDFMLRCRYYFETVNNFHNYVTNYTIMEVHFIPGCICME